MGKPSGGRRTVIDGTPLLKQKNHKFWSLQKTTHTRSAALNDMRTAVFFVCLERSGSIWSHHHISPTKKSEDRICRDRMPALQLRLLDENVRRTARKEIKVQQRLDLSLGRSVAAFRLSAETSFKKLEATLASMYLQAWALKAAVTGEWRSYRALLLLPPPMLPHCSADLHSRPRRLSLSLSNQHTHTHTYLERVRRHSGISRGKHQPALVMWSCGVKPLMKR